MLVLPAELTHAQAGACLRLLLQALHAEQGAAVQVDATTLVRFDSSAIAVLLECRRAALGQGKAFGVKALPAALASLAQLYGVQELLPAA
ncbi:STAS domain-containing protein [Comamonas faecalis]|uniref:STAS domain-containing protein n=1 Tax=Comamonas faecalis TaxID=1387849 RepID=A0ABP7R9A6_9BURK